MMSPHASRCRALSVCVSQASDGTMCSWTQAAVSMYAAGWPHSGGELSLARDARHVSREVSALPLRTTSARASLKPRKALTGSLHPERPAGPTR